MFNKEVFLDTEEQYLTHPVLKEAVANSIANQEICLENEYKPKDYMTLEYLDTKVVVSGKRSFEAAKEYANEGKRVAVLNFANAFHPGGGVRNGASAQEEALCRCSTLLPCLETPENMEKFYDYHDRTINCLANDDCIYTPDVVVFKTDNASPIIMPENEWYKVDVITCAAPDLRDDWIGSVSDRMLYDIHVKRAKKIFDVAMDHRVDAIVLGAFGCGVFSNNPDVVASAYAEVQQNYMGRLHNIEYAIYHLRGTKSPNYRAFRDVMLEEE